MIKHKYGKFTEEQILKQKEKIRKSIFWLILYTDPKTKDEYQHVNAVEYQKKLMKKISGFNSLLMDSVDLVEVLSILESALIELEKDSFNFQEYRKLVFDAGALLKEGD